MIEINLYQPQKFDINIDLPDSWDELTHPELLFIAKTLLQQSEENASQTRGLILKFLIAQRLPRRRPAHWFETLDPEDLVISAYPILDFIFEKNNRTTLPLPFTFHFVNYKARPFEDITCGEFEDCEIAAVEFQQDPSEKLLAQLAAILFRPEGKPYLQYAARTDSYLNYHADKKVKYFLKLKPWELYSIFIWYAGCRNQLQYLFADIYDGSKKSGQPDPLAFTNTIHAGAGPKNGSRNQIRCMKLYEFLYDCNQEAKKAKELKEEYDKINN